MVGGNPGINRLVGLLVPQLVFVIVPRVVRDHVGRDQQRKEVKEPGKQVTEPKCDSNALAMRSVSIRLIVPFRRVDIARIGLTHCCADTMMSSFLGCACVVMALPEERPLTNGLIDPAPSAPPVAPPIESQSSRGLRNLGGVRGSPWSTSQVLSRVVDRPNLER